MSPPPRRPTGRRPGTPGTRDAVLAAARAGFAERGYAGATIRRIATDAGVDPALVHHYFGTKDQLFLAAVDAPVDPAALLAPVLAGPREDVGVGVVRTLLQVWDGPAGPTVLALLRSAVTDERTAALLREFLQTRVLGPVLAGLAVPDAEVRARSTLVATQLVGLLVARFVLRLEPVATADPEQVAAALGPTVQRYLTGDVALPG